MDFHAVLRATSKSRVHDQLLNEAEKDLVALSKELTKRWGLSRSELAARLRLNPRLTRSVARYRRETGVIELGPRFFHFRTRRKEVLCHELAHVAVELLYGKPVRPHGIEWRNLVESAGFVAHARLPVTPGRCADLPRTGEYPPSDGPGYRPAEIHYVYEHRCPVCQMIRRARRPVGQWRCANCVAADLPGTLSITRIVRR